MLHGDGRGGLTAVDLPRSGIAIDGQIRAIRALKADGRILIVVARNDASLVVLRPTQ